MKEALVKAWFVPHGGGFCATFAEGDYQSAKRMADVHGLEVRAYGVDLEAVGEHKTAARWRRTPGWSTWTRDGEPPEGELPRPPRYITRIIDDFGPVPWDQLSAPE